MKKTITMFAAAILLIFLSCQNTPKEKTTPIKPNIIYILADDLSYRDLSCYGQLEFETPNIDQLVAKGVRFTQAYAGAPECAPSRGTLLTGLHAGHAPIRINSSARGQDFIPDSVITVAEVLKNAGYSTGFVGKWGVGLPGTEGVPHKQGFDFAFGFYDQGRAHTYFPFYLIENGKKIEYPGNYQFDMQRRYDMNASHEDFLLNKYDENGKLVLSELDDQSKAVYSQNEIDNAAFRFLNENGQGEQPFFLYYATQLPHGPVIIDDLGDMKNNQKLPQRQKEWAAMVIRLDSFVEELVAQLKKLDQYENTIIFFSSDNGYSMCGYMGRGNANTNWPDDPFLKNKGPFRGGKFSALEGGIRVPFFVSAPKYFKPQTISDPVWLVDFFSTAADIAGINVPRHTDGNSLLPLIQFGDKTQFENRPMYFYKDTEQAVRMGSWKAYRESPQSKMELYLIEEDVHSDRDLSKFYPEVVKQIDSIMSAEHENHAWYRNPWETPEEYKMKIKKAKESGTLQISTRPNGL
ncbi:MAG TPA: arylsulfatase [Draconibacterium sp.]|nr:arylsulfatase [Draconibacterium sp.]